MKKNEKIYIAGHTGMVGSALVRRLRAEGYDNLLLRDMAELDLLDQKATADFFAQKKPDYVFLAAAKVGGIVANNTYRGQFIYENLQIQNNILHFSHLHGVKKLLFLGSSCIYPKHAVQPIREEELLGGPLEETNEPYAIAKIAGIKMCQAYRTQYGCSFVAVMPTNLYGPFDNYNLHTSHVLPAFIRKFHLAACLERDDWQSLRADLNRRPLDNITGADSEIDILTALAAYGIHRKSDHRAVTLTLWGSGVPRREFLYVDDLADACLFLMQNYDDPEIVNIGVGEDLSIAELAQMVRSIAGSNAAVDFDASKPDGTPRKLLDVRRMSALGWKASTSLEHGIRQTLAWYRKSLEDMQTAG